MNRAVAEVHELLLTLHPQARATVMTRVGRRYCITAPQACGQRVGVDVPIPAAVSHRFEFSIPIRRGQPNLNLDIGLARRLQRRRNPAKRGQVAELRSTTSSST